MIILSKSKLASLVDRVIMPLHFEFINKFKISQDEKIINEHDFILSKLSICMLLGKSECVEDFLNSIYELHVKFDFNSDESLKFFEDYFKYFMEWVEKDYALYVTKLETDLKIYKEKVQSSFATQKTESNFLDFDTNDKEEDGFFDFDSEEVEDAIENMHYKDEQKQSALEFMGEGVLTEDDLHELDEIVNESLEIVIQDFDEAYLKMIEKFLGEFITIFNISYVFKDLAYSLELLRLKVWELDLDSLSKEQKDLYKMLFESILEDLRKWYDEVVVEQSAKDIHYLDASLFANIAQIDIAMQSTSKQESKESKDEEEFEFF